MQRDAYLQLSPGQMRVAQEHLCSLLALLRAQYLSYQTSHWQVSGDSFYGNHLLFQRLYEAVQVEIDELAEKIVGYAGHDKVSLGVSTHKIVAWTDRWAKVKCHHRRGLLAEEDFQAVVKDTYDHLKEADVLTLGLDDWLMAAASNHETHTYLLQQVLAGARPKVADQDGSYMTVQHLRELHEHSEELLGQVTPTTMLPDWAESKVTESAAGLRAVYEYMAHGRGRHLASEPVAPSREDEFFDNPQKREVKEFADSRAVTNEPDVAVKSAPELDVSLTQEMKDVRKAPPTPDEVKKQPGGEEFATLNRFVVETQEPVPGVPQGREEVPKHPDIVASELEKLWWE